MSNKKYDIIIVGAGLVGLSTAYHWQKLNPTKRILVIEKESEIAKHQSGNNSGVLHSGIYYKPGSLKAENCITGYNSMIQFAKDHGIPYDICGKLIVATSADELNGLDNIYKRGLENGLVGIKKLSKEATIEIEPHCAALASIHVPQAGIIDYPLVAKKLLEIFLNTGGEIVFSEAVIKITSNTTGVRVETNSRIYESYKLVTCAGLHSDRIASLTETKNDLRIIPFRGEYYKLSPEKQYLVRNLIYPVPDPNFPFLGVHFTRMIGGGIEAGPNAVLAFKREGYKFSDFNLRDTKDTFLWPGFWKIVMKYGRTGMGEIYRSLSKSAFTQALQKLIPEIQESDLVPGGAGVRAQACDRSGFLIDDFNIIKRDNIVHIRNAPSPAATASLAIGKMISEKMLS